MDQVCLEFQEILWLLSGQLFQEIQVALLLHLSPLAHRFLDILVVLVHHLAQDVQVDP